MEKIQAAVSLALLDTETCTAAADVRELQKPGAPEDLDDRRVLAVVIHTYRKVVNTGDVEGDGDVIEEEGW